MITCPVCQGVFRSLMSHARNRHGLDTAAFRRLFPGVAMVSSETRQSVSRSCIGKGRKPGTPMGEWQKAMYSRMFSGQSNPFHGKKHSGSTRQQMSKNHADVSGDKNPFRKALRSDTAKREAASRRSKEHWVRFRGSPSYAEYLEKMRLNGVAAVERNGGHGGRGHKSGWFYSERMGVAIFYRSSYEFAFFEECELDLSLRSFEACPLRIQYVDDAGSRRIYVPDFLLNGTDIIEIKPVSLRGFGTNPAKFSAAIAFAEKCGYHFRVVDENSLPYPSEALS